MGEPSSVQARRVGGNRGDGSPGPRHGRRFFAARGFLSGVAGGVCCFAAAIAAGLGLGGVGLFGRLMDRYQPFFLVASLLLMGFWLRRAARGTVAGGGGARGVVRAVSRPAVVMGVTWSVTLVVAMVAARVAGLG